MPPKPKFARREIVEAALDLVSRRGPEARPPGTWGSAWEAPPAHLHCLSGDG